MVVGEGKAGTETYIRGFWCDSYANYQKFSFTYNMLHYNIKPIKILL